jgi:hypothetical protein
MNEDGMKPIAAYPGLEKGVTALVSLCCPGAGQVYVTKAGRNQS